MRHLAALLLASTLAATAAQAQTRIIAQNNGWTAFGGTAENGAAVCGLETRDPNTGRHLLMQHIVGQERPIVRLSRPSWNLPAGSSWPVRIVIDNRQVFNATGVGAGQAMSWPLVLDRFESAFRLGTVVRVEFPNGPDSPWNLSLTGTNAVMGAFVGCMRMMVIQPGEAPPIQPPPSLESPPMGPPLEDPTRPPEPPRATPPAELPRRGLPEDKPGQMAPGGKPGSDGKPGPATPL